MGTPRGFPLSCFSEPRLSASATVDLGRDLKSNRNTKESGGFMGIYMILPDLWVPQLMASLVVIDSTMIIIVDDMEVS